jgi:hypothetical protein
MKMFSLAFDLMAIRIWHVEFGTETEHKLHIAFEILLKVSTKKYGGG